MLDTAPIFSGLVTRHLSAEDARQIVASKDTRREWDEFSQNLLSQCVEKSTCGVAKTNCGGKYYSPCQCDFSRELQDEKEVESFTSLDFVLDVTFYRKETK